MFKTLLILLLILIPIDVYAQTPRVTNAGHHPYRHTASELSNAVGTGDITSVGDCTGPDCFGGVSGSILTIGTTTGVVIQVGSAGILTFQGVGNTNNEAMTLDLESASNQIDFSSSTGASFRFLKAVKIIDEGVLRFGNSTDITFVFEASNSVDHLQIGTKVASAGGTGHISIMEIGDLGVANRDPSGTSVDPVLRIYSSDATQADDYIEMFHDQTNGIINVGNGVVSIPDGITSAGTIEGATLTQGGVAAIIADGSIAFTAALRLFSDATPTTATAGYIAFDSNGWAASRGAAQLYDGTATTYLIGALVSDAPSNGQVPKWNTGGTITWENDDNTASITIADTLVAYALTADNLGGEAAFAYNDSTDTLTVGSISLAASATPSVDFTDSDTTDEDVSTRILTNCTDTGSGTEDCDMTFSQQIAGTLTAFITANADGDTTIVRLAATNATFVTPALGTPASGVMTNVTGIVSAGINDDVILYADILDADQNDTKCITIEDPVDADDIMFYRANRALTITSVDCIVEDSTSAGLVVVECDSAGDNCGSSRFTESLTCDTNGATDDGVTEAGVVAGAYMRIQIGTVTGTVNAVTTCFSLTYDD